MKKEIAIFLIIFISLSLVSAKPICSDGTTPDSSDDELEIGLSKVINGLGIGLTKTEERVFYKKVSADLIIDARRVDLSNSSSSQEIELLTGKYTVKFENSTDTNAQLSIDGESKTLEENEVETIKGLFVMVSNAEVTEGGKVRAVVGAKQLTLSNTEKPEEKISFGNKTFVIELNTASTSNALLTVYKCLTGEISILTIQKNETNNETALNQSSQINQTAPVTNNESISENNSSGGRQVTVEEANAIINNKSMNSSNNDTIIESQNPESNNPGFFSRLWNWVKGLFS
ncbi:MAG: hypothetical protein Q7S27_05855 [Nanoarchaeota archaeon]|nr:hypothetical protein [Nanoarchaeota archaeon]